MNSAAALPNEFCVLLVDDDEGVHAAVGAMLRRTGWAFRFAATPAAAHAILATEAIDVILLDLNFARGQTDGEEGFLALSRILTEDPDAAVVVITGHSGIRIAVAAMRAGACDFVMKPWRNEDLLTRLDAAALARRRQIEVAGLRGASSEMPSLHVLGECQPIVVIRDLVRRVGPTLADVLICGPGGSGKALVAALLHKASVASDQPLTTFDVRRLAFGFDDLRNTIEGSTAVLLRYIDELDTIAQARLVEELPVDLRVFATAQDGAALIPALLARVGTIELKLPALEQRGGDAVLLAQHFLNLAARKHARPGLQLSEVALGFLGSAVWPDNVRSLARTIERAVVLADDDIINLVDLGLDSTGAANSAIPQVAIPPTLEAAERRLIAGALRRHGFNVSNAANELGLSRGSLYRRISKFGL